MFKRQSKGHNLRFRAAGSKRLLGPQEKRPPRRWRTSAVSAAPRRDTFVAVGNVAASLTPGHISGGSWPKLDWRPIVASVVFLPPDTGETRLELPELGAGETRTPAAPSWRGTLQRALLTPTFVANPPRPKGAVGLLSSLEAASSGSTHQAPQYIIFSLITSYIFPVSGFPDVQSYWLSHLERRQENRDSR